MIVNENEMNKLIFYLYSSFVTNLLRISQTDYLLLSLKYRIKSPHKHMSEVLQKIPYEVLLAGFEKRYHLDSSYNIIV